MEKNTVKFNVSVNVPGSEASNRLQNTLYKGRWVARRNPILGDINLELNLDPRKIVSSLVGSEVEGVSFASFNPADANFAFRFHAPLEIKRACYLNTLEANDDANLLPFECYVIKGTLCLENDATKCIYQEVGVSNGSIVVVDCEDGQTIVLANQVAKLKCDFAKQSFCRVTLSGAYIFDAEQACLRDGRGKIVIKHFDLDKFKKIAYSCSKLKS